MPDVTGNIQGLDQLNAKLAALKAGMNGPPIAKAALAGARVIVRQAKQNARRGPTGMTIKGINAFAGRKAFKFGAIAVARARWKGTGAIFEEWGRKDMTPADTLRPGMLAFRIPLSKWSGGESAVGRGKRAMTTGVFGYSFFRKLKGMEGNRFFESAVEQKGQEALDTVTSGCNDLILDAIR